MRKIGRGRMGTHIERGTRMELILLLNGDWKGAEGGGTAGRTELDWLCFVMKRLTRVTHQLLLNGWSCVVRLD